MNGRIDNVFYEYWDEIWFDCQVCGNGISLENNIVGVREIHRLNDGVKFYAMCDCKECNRIRRVEINKAWAWALSSGRYGGLGNLTKH